MAPDSGALGVMRFRYKEPLKLLGSSNGVLTGFGYGDTLLLRIVIESRHMSNVVIEL